MKNLNSRLAFYGTRGSALVLTVLLVSACAMSPASPQGSAEVRSRLTALQNNPDLSGRARIELREAETAVRIAEQPLPDDEAALATHRVYMADRKVSIAEAKANTQFAEAQRTRISEEREEARLQARTREADRARSDASLARSDAERARNETDTARSDAARARVDSETARSAADAAQESERAMAGAAAREAEDYQRQIDALQAETTSRGLVLTLGDVLFATGSAELQSGTNQNLDRLVDFLNEYPERRVLIEGHTDNVGNAEYNRNLSRQRAESVKSYLTQQGIASRALSVSGIGMDRPVTGNDTASGRQQNRRVEIIIENPSGPVEQRRL